MDSTGRIRVVGDLRVTDTNDIRRGYPFAALKNVILSPDLLVAYAGNAELGMHTIRQVATQLNDQREVFAFLLESSQRAGQGNGSVDYVVAEAGKGLSRIAADGVQASRDASWIGDRGAFEIYQQGFHEIPVSEPIHIPGESPEGPLPIGRDELEVAARTLNGILNLELRAVESVGEAFLWVRTSAASFCYDTQAYLAADHGQVVTGDEWQAADWGTVAEGGFGYSTLVPTRPGIGLLGLYFPHAGLGLLYHPLLQDDAFVYSGVTHGGFREAVAAEHGVDIDGPTFRGAPAAS